MIHLILGGARSGKSRHAQRLAEASRLAVTLIATGEAGDLEMAERIARHRAERPGHWRTLEEPLQLARAIVREAEAGRLVLVDCLTLWLSNWLDPARVEGYQAERAALLAALPDLPGEVVLVANEVGLGIIPLGELTRRFVDEAGRLNQDVARIADGVTLLAAGLPMELKAREKQ